MIFLAALYAMAVTIKPYNISIAVIKYKISVFEIPFTSWANWEFHIHIIH
jgi:hypothetical protein